MLRTSGIALAALGIINFSIAGSSVQAQSDSRVERRSDWISQSTTSATNTVSIEVRDGYRYIQSNGIPEHATGQFPNARNPNTISPQSYSFRVPAQPELAASITPTSGPFGIAINGVPFDPGTAEFWQNDRTSGWRYEGLGTLNLGMDRNNAHVQSTGAYHYHGMPEGLLEHLSSGDRTMQLVGYAADGFPIYARYGFAEATNPSSSLQELQPSYRLKPGQRSGGPGGSYDGTFVQDYEYIEGLGDLDECNGRIGVTADYPEGTYYYILSTNFPFIPRCFRGTPDSSFQASRPEASPTNGPNQPSGQGRGERPFPPPPGHPPGDRPPHPPR